MSVSRKSNRAQRRQISKGFSKKIKTQWGTWEFRNEALSSPLAPKGIYKACCNQIYSVQFFRHKTKWGNVVRLIIRRHDGKAGIPWPHRQRIKNELIGEDWTAIEVFPPENQVVDEANCYHLWVLPQQMTLPFGLWNDDTLVK